MTSNPRMQLDDAAVRARVLDGQRSFIVQAPAGSGKTELLMQRYLVLLAEQSVAEPEAVLAITFTRKAAAEMRNRVLAALESAGGPAPEKAHERTSWELARKVAERDRTLGWNLRDHPERLEIRTVDSFCEKIANRTPLLARMGQAPAIAEDFEALYAEAAQRTLLLLGDADEANRAAIAHVLLDQDNNLGRVERLLTELLAKRDQWLRLIGGSLERSPEEQAKIRAELERSLQDAIEYELATIRQQIVAHVPAGVLDCLFEHARFGAGNVESAHELAALRKMWHLPDPSISDLPAWRGLSEFCLTSGKNFRKQYDSALGFPPGGIHKKRKDACANLLKEIAESDYAEVFCAALCRVTKLPPAQYTPEQWESLMALLRVLPLAVASLRTVFAERGEVDHTEVALAATEALGAAGEPTDLALHLGYKVQHVLVDEFQDTSVEQAELLERLIHTWAPESGATLFVVGDPMQSIYSFRQAEVTLFQRAREHGFAHGEWPLEDAQLTRNFRSRPELVGWFNEVFPSILTEDDAVKGAVRYAAAAAARESSSAAEVRFHSASADDKVAEAARVVEIVAQELAAGTKSIAILVRSRSHLSEIAPALRRAGIPFRATKIDTLAARQTVRDLHAITRALLHLGDRTAWLALLRGPWCGLELAELWELCGGAEQTNQTIWELLQARRRDLCPRAQRVLERILPAIERAIADRERVPLRHIVEGLWISLGGPAALSGPDRETGVREAAAYLELLQKTETNGEVDEKRLEREMEALHTPPDTGPGIRVELMTIHGAKGLEFEAVIVPGLNCRTATNKTQLLNWRERVIGDRRDLLLAPMEPVGVEPYEETPISKYINRLGSESGLEESKRLLYVAATRARERLHFVSTLPPEDKAAEAGLFALLPPQVRSKFPAQPEPEEKDEASARPPRLLRRLPATWRLPSPPEPVAFARPYPGAADAGERKHTFVRVGEDLRRIGTVTHRLLQQIGEEGLEAWPVERVPTMAPAVRALLLQQGVRGANLSGAQQRVQAALQNSLRERYGRWILQKRASARNEYALFAVLDGRRESIKVDRTFVEDGVRWVVDYKTSDREGTITESYLKEQIEKYRGDLARYARILHALDGLPIKGGLYFPLLQLWREVDFPS